MVTRDDTFFYKIYGLNIASGLLLPELLPNKGIGKEVIHITITKGFVPEYIHREIKKGITYCYNNEVIWFVIEKVAIYYVSDGTKIIIQPYEDANNDDLKTYLLGSAFGALLIQRNMIAIHGGAIVVNNKAIIITGTTGAGKSTLTTAFRLRGSLFLADDVSVIKVAEGEELQVYPAYPQQKLCGDSVEKLGYICKGLKLIDPERDKYAVPLENEVFVNKPVDLASIYELTIGDSKKVEIVQVTGREKIKLLYENIFRIGYTKEIGLSPFYYKNYIQIVQKATVYRITRPRDRFTVEQQIDLIRGTL
jgi:hypothetical protein